MKKKNYFEKINEKISENIKSEIIEKLNKEFGENDFCHFVGSLSELGDFGSHFEIIKYKIKTYIKTGKWLSFKFLFLNLNDYELGYSTFDNRIPAMKAFRDEYAHIHNEETDEIAEITDNSKNAEYSIVDYEDWKYRGIVLPILSDDKYIIAGYDESIDEFNLFAGLKTEKAVKNKLLEITEDEEYTNEMISHFMNDAETIEAKNKNGGTVYLRLIEVC